MLFKLRRLGACGVVRLGSQGYQIIIGTDVEFVTDALKSQIEQANQKKQRLMAQKKAKMHVAVNQKNHLTSKFSYRN